MSSASNEGFQQQHDANDLLIKGASAAAAGRELGLSEEETLAAVSRNYRRQQQRAAYRDRNKEKQNGVKSKHRQELGAMESFRA